MTRHCALFISSILLVSMSACVDRSAHDTSLADHAERLRALEARVAELETEVAVMNEQLSLAAAPEGTPPASPRCDVILLAAGDQKIAVIKAIRTLTGIGLQVAKDMADNPPSRIREQVDRAQAEAARDALQAAGAKVELRCP
jgi:large subunit ribosomal protein L7/L12